MAIPKYNELMFPVLEVLSDEKDHSLKEIVDILGRKYKLTDEELSIEIPSGGKLFYGRVGWARTYLKAAKLIDSPKRSIFSINERGKKALKDKPDNMLAYLKQYDDFINFENRSKKSNSEKNGSESKSETPDEMLAHAQELYKDNLQIELLEKLKSVDPVRFEEIVLILMEKMNYGVDKMTKLSHDGGIDGIIDEDELGLANIFTQNKIDKILNNFDKVIKANNSFPEEDRIKIDIKAKKLILEEKASEKYIEVLLSILNLEPHQNIITQDIRLIADQRPSQLSLLGRLGSFFTRNNGDN